MLHPSTKKLIDRLCEMTLQRKIDWVSGDRADTMAYDTEGYRVLLEGNPAELILCDALGNELERADNATMTATQNADGTSYDELVETMRVEASRIARGAEDAIASVLGGLDLDGDGIPDVPAPIELEDAPDGPAAHRLDNVEDTVDEMTGLEDQAAQTEALPAADLDALTPSETYLPESHGEHSLEEAPDVGEAVANLAQQVNNTPPQAATDTGTSEPSAASGGLLKAGGLITSGVGFNALNNSLDDNNVVESTLEPQDLTNTMDGEPIDVDAPFEPSKPLNSVPKPGHILSLSGLTGDLPQFETSEGVDGDLNETVPSLAETIVATPDIDTIEETASDALIPDDLEPDYAQPVQPEQVHSAEEIEELEDISEVLTNDAPVAPSEPVDDTAEPDPDAAPQQPKRFNPWI